MTIRGAVPEMVVMYRKTATDKKNDVTFSGVDSQEALGFKRGGTAAMKIVDTVDGFLTDARHVLTNLAVQHEDNEQSTGNAEMHGYADLETAVAHWGLKRFTNFMGDVEIKRANKVPLTQFEKDCLAVHTRLAMWVRHREEVSDDVFSWRAHACRSIALATMTRMQQPTPSLSPSSAGRGNSSESSSGHSTNG